MKKVAVIGSGPAGCSASIYLAQAGIQTLMFTGSIIGGQLIYTESVTNFIGSRWSQLGSLTGKVDSFYLTGQELMSGILEQVKTEGVELINEEVDQIKVQEKQFEILYSHSFYEKVDAIIIATGATPKLLGRGEEEFWGKGVSTCAVCDGNFFKGQPVAVIGSGDTACEEALYLAKICEKVYLLNRGNSWKANNILQELVKAEPKIEIRLNTEVEQFMGTEDGPLEYLYLKNLEDKRELKVSAAFIAIGVIPQSKLVENLNLTDTSGYIMCYGNRSTTAIKGIFSAGDVSDRFYRQAIVAAGDGCKAALECIAYLNGTFL